MQTGVLMSPCRACCTRRSVTVTEVSLVSSLSRLIVLHTQVGDILLKVDGSEVHSTEDASKLILGERGTKIAMLFKRFEENEKGEGKIRKFTVHLVRGTASGG